MYLPESNTPQECTHTHTPTSSPPTRPLTDGWWTYKMYSPESNTPQECTSWSYREGLFKDIVARTDADVVCLQEIAPESFETDFRYLGG